MSAALSIRDEKPIGSQELAPRSQRSSSPLPALLVLALQRASRRFASSPTSCSELQQAILITLWLSTNPNEQRVSLQTWLYSVAEGITIPLPERTPCSVDPEPAAVLLTVLDTFLPAEREAALLALQQFELPQIADALRCSPRRAGDLLAKGQRRLQLWLTRLASPASSAQTG